MVHEWAIAESIVLYLKNQNYGRVKKLVLRIGALQSLDREVLLFAIKELASQYGLEAEHVEVLEEEPTLKCNVCGYEWSINTSAMSSDIREAIHFLPEVVYAYYKCPFCGSRDFEVVKGRGVVVEKVEPA